MKARFRKIWTLPAAAALGLAFVFAGCSGGGGETEAQTQTETETETETDQSEYADLAGIYWSDLSVEGGMAVELYLEIGEEGEFVFSRSTDFSDKSKGAGYLGKDEDGDDAFIYEIVRGAEAEEGENVSKFEVTEDGEIQFLSLMWFGSTTPRLTDSDGKETYPLFVPYEEGEQKETETEEESGEAETESGERTEAASQPTAGSSAAAPAKTETVTTAAPAATTASTAAAPATAAPATTAAPAPTPAPTTAPVPTAAPTPAPEAFQEGTYTGTYTKHIDAMGSDIRYDMRLTMAGGSYTYQVNLTVSGSMSHSESQTYTGTYTVNGTSLTMSGTLSGGTVQGSSLTVTGVLSSFAGGNDTVTLNR